MLFYATEDIEDIEIAGEIDMAAASELLEVIDRESEEVLWTKTWDKSTVSSFTIPLEHLLKNREYTLQFSATGVSKASIQITYEDSRLQERAKPNNKKLRQ